MGKGDIVQTKIPLPEIAYTPQVAGDTAEGGDPVAFGKSDSTSGQILKATDSTAGATKILTHLKNTEGSPAYLVSGLIECVAGGKIRPNSYVKVNSSSKLIDSSTKGDAVGFYLRRASDPLGNPSDAADDVAIIVRVIS